MRAIRLFIVSAEELSHVDQLLGAALVYDLELDMKFIENPYGRIYFKKAVS